MQIVAINGLLVTPVGPPDVVELVRVQRLQYVEPLPELPVAVLGLSVRLGLGVRFGLCRGLGRTVAPSSVQVRSVLRGLVDRADGLEGGHQGLDAG